MLFQEQFFKLTTSHQIWKPTLQTLSSTSNSFNLWWRNISAIYRFLVLRSVIFLFPIAGPSLPGLAWPPACLSAGRPAHLSSQPADCQHSQSCLKITRIQKYLLYKTLFYVEQPPSAYHIPPLKKSCENHACDFFFFLKWHGNNLMKWQTKKRWLFVKWKHEHHAQLTNFASVRNSMVPNLNLLSSLTTLAVKKQAQFNEKKYLQEDQFWL